MPSPFDSVPLTPVVHETPPDDSDGIPHVTHEGSIQIAGTTFRVLQLSDGQRIIPEEDFIRFLGLLEQPQEGGSEG